MNELNRRRFVQRTALAGFSLLALTLPNRGMADPEPPASGPGASPALPPEPEIFRFKLGNADAYVIHDGVFQLPTIQPVFCPEAKPAELQELLDRSFLTDRLALSLNVLAIRSKSGVMLFDAGGGSGMGAAAGRLVRGLNALGIAPKDVVKVYVTHAHPDHIAGLLTGDSHTFPNARIVIDKREADFWLLENPDLSGMRIPDEGARGAHAAIKKSLESLKPNLDLVAPGKLSDEVELIAAPGHTPGHGLFQLTFGTDKLLVIGDAVHVAALQFVHPEWTMAFDVNPGQAIGTRRKLFKEAAAGRQLLMGYHMPFPGLGHVRAVGDAFDWVPRPWVS